MATITPEPTRVRLLILSDTHGLNFSQESDLNKLSIDVLIHCGDLTEHSTLEEYKRTIELLTRIQADVKNVIAGNHDFSLDDRVLEAKVEEAQRIGVEADKASIEKAFGTPGMVRRLFEALESEGVLFLDEGHHNIKLANERALKIYASPYTPSTTGEWGFQYTGSHAFDIEPNTDIAITHGPPRGVMDLTAEKKRIGCEQLFASVARAKPRIHCFGHVHNGWGAKMATWRPAVSEKPTHFGDIDHGLSTTVETLRTMSSDSEWHKKGYRLTSHRFSDGLALGLSKTLFLNAAMKGEEGLDQLPWVVDFDIEASANEDEHNSDQLVAAGRKRRHKSEEQPYVASDEESHKRKNVQ